MSEYKILKLSSPDKGTLYVIQKWVHQEKNLYGERLEQAGGVQTLRGGRIDVGHDRKMKHPDSRNRIIL